MAPLAQDMQDFEQKTLNSVNYLLTQLASYPNFPSKDKVINDTNKLLNKFNELINVNNQLTQAVKKMEQALQSNPANIPDQAQEALRKVASVSNTTSRNIESETAQINSLLNNIQQTTDWCNEWKLYCDLFNKLNYITNFVSNNLADIAANLLIAEQTDGMPYVKAQTIGTVCNIVGTAVTGASVIGLLNYAVGTFTSLSKAMFEELMAKFCTLFKGKVTADYHTELLHKEVPFFTMDYKLAGDVELIFQKRNPGDPEVKLEGDFKAKADDFESSITMVPFALPTSITLGFTRCPVPLIGRRTSLLYLEGNAKADELEIKLKKASYDYKLKARAYYIILGSHQPIPIPGDLEFPLMNAEWVLTRSTEISNPKKEYFILPIEIKNGKSIAEKEFNREIYLPETPNRKAVRVVMKLKMELFY